MEKFNALKPLKTECGFQAEVMFFDFKSDFPMHVKIIRGDGSKITHAYTEDGFYRKDKQKHFLDLVNHEVKNELSRTKNY